MDELSGLSGHAFPPSSPPAPGLQTVQNLEAVVLKAYFFLCIKFVKLTRSSLSPSGCSFLLPFCHCYPKSLLLLLFVGHSPKNFLGRWGLSRLCCRVWSTEAQILVLPEGALCDCPTHQCPSRLCSAQQKSESWFWGCGSLRGVSPILLDTLGTSWESKLCYRKVLLHLSSNKYEYYVLLVLVYAVLYRHLFTLHLIVGMPLSQDLATLAL